MQAITIRFSNEEYQVLALIAEQTERSRNDIIREAPRNHPDYLKFKKGKENQP